MAMAEQRPATGRGVLDGRAALVTAGGSGIGLGIATRFAAEGARVLLADIDGDKVEAAARELGPLARAMKADARDEADQRRMVAAALERPRDPGVGPRKVCVPRAVGAIGGRQLFTNRQCRAEALQGGGAVLLLEEQVAN